MSAMMISRIKVRDQSKFQEYLQAVQRLAAPYGAEMVYRGQVADMLNGDRDHALVVVVKFPDNEKLNALFGSDAYKELVPLREAGAEMHMTGYAAL